MNLVFVLVGLAALTQDDPAVSYREGLYQEIDEGDLAKAVTLYEKVISSEAPAALKAKALFRKAYCFEKQGKKKDAELIYRDITERYAGEEPVIKLVRSRLAAGDATSAAPIETQIQQLILDLGSSSWDTTRYQAIQRMALIGNTCVPELRRALSHKDPELSMGAATVLIRLEQYDGTYAPFSAALKKEHVLNPVDVESLTQLIKLHEPSRKAFAQDYDSLPWRAVYQVQQIPGALGMKEMEPQLAKRVVDWDGKVTDPFQFTPVSAWSQVRTAKNVATLLDKLVDVGRITYVLFYGDPVELKDADVEAAVIRACERIIEIKDFASIGSKAFQAALRWLDPSIVFGKVFPTWAKSKNGEHRRAVMKVVAQYVSGAPFHKSYYYDQLLAFLEQPKEYPEDVRESALIEIQGESLSKEQSGKLAKYYVGYVQGLDASNTIDEGNLYAIVRFLVANLPEKSKEIDNVLDKFFATLSDSFIKGTPTPLNGGESVYSRFRLAALRALEGGRVKSIPATLYFVGVGDLSDFQRLAKLIPAIKDDALAATAINKLEWYNDRWSNDEERSAAEAIRPLLESDRVAIRRAAFYRVHGLEAFDPFAKKAIADPDEGVRGLVMMHWNNRKSESGFPEVLKGLKDTSRMVRAQAIVAANAWHLLDAAPALIDLLHSADDSERRAAEGALQNIKKYYQSQEDWKKWYREIKKD